MGKKESPKSEGSEAWMLPLFGGLVLAFGVFLLAQCGNVIWADRVAQSWALVDCEILQSELVERSEGEVTLNLLYRYTFDGIDYRSDRVHFLPDSIQVADGSWEREFQRVHPVGLGTVCFVDPHDPNKAVLSRSRGIGVAWLLFIIAFVPACIGVGLFLTAAVPLQDRLKHTIREKTRQYPIPTPPRRISWSSTLAILLASPHFIWLFVVALAYVFCVFDGGGAVVDAMHVGDRNERAIGTVISVQESGHRVFGEPHYEYGFSFRQIKEEKLHRGTSATLGQQYSVGDEVPIEYNAIRPELARILGAKSTATPRWIGVGSIGIMAMFVLMWAVAIRHNFGVLRLLHNGVPTSAVAKRTSTTAYMFEVDGQQYKVKCVAPVDKARASETTYDDLTVLFDREAPQNNLAMAGLEHHIFPSSRAALVCLQDIIVPVLAIAAVVSLVVVTYCI